MEVGKELGALNVFNKVRFNERFKGDKLLKMKEMKLSEAIKRSKKIRERYHALEQQHHGSEWTIEEDALAFLTDAGLVGRLTMSQQRRWPKSDTVPDLEHKLGECVWWLTVLADRMDMDISELLDKFLTKTEKMLKP